MASTIQLGGGGSADAVSVSVSAAIVNSSKLTLKVVIPKGHVQLLVGYITIVGWEFSATVFDATTNKLTHSDFNYMSAREVKYNDPTSGHTVERTMFTVYDIVSDVEQEVVFTRVATSGAYSTSSRIFAVIQEVK